MRVGSWSAIPWGMLAWFVGAGCGGGGGRVADAAVDSGGPADAATAPPLFKLSDTAGLRLQVASDRTGAPVVMWTDGLGKAESAYWTQATDGWVPMPALDVTDPLLVDPNGSGHPLVEWNVAPDPLATDRAVRRFDSTSAAWGPLVSLPGPRASSYSSQIVIDGAGDAHSFWRDIDGNDYWSWWQPGAAGWQPAMPFEETYRLVAAPVSTFMWFERNTLGVRRFDAVAGTWSSPVQLADLTKESSLRTHTLVVGRDGAPLMASLRRDADQLVVEAWHGQVGTNEWGARELVEAIPMSTSATVLYGPLRVLADPSQSFLWVPVPLADGTVDWHIERYDPGTGAWAEPWVLHDNAFVVSLDLRADGHGVAYGYSDDGLLLRYDPAAPGWQQTQSGIGGGVLRTSDGGAFVVGYRGTELVALRSDAGGPWRPARGYAGGAQPSVGSTPYAMEIAGPERAVVAWTVDHGPDAGVWAAFLE